MAAVDGVGEIVGRDAELEMVRSVLTSLPGGPRALLLEGQAGIGKTALWRAALAEAGANDIRVLSCVADQAEAGLAFVGLGDLVRDVLDHVRVGLSDPQREALEMALLERRSASGPPPDAKTAGVALRALLVELSQETPVVVAVDDVQWLDAETARALAFAVRRLSGLPVGVLATVRVPHAVPDVLGLERALGPGLSRVRLEALSLGALRALLALRLGYSYPRPVLVRIADTSGGNPLFALEIARALGPSPSLQAGAPLPVPESLRELVVDRLAALPSSARTSLLVASALSHPRIELVERCSSSSGLNAAEEAGLLRTEDGRVIFTHPLYASAVYSSAATGHRRELHRRLAELASEPEERARHLALATRAPDEDVAAALEEAAALARARGAWETAGELLEQARALTPGSLADAAQARGVRAAEHYIRAGDRPRARVLLEEILLDTPPGPTRSDGLRLLAEVCYNDYNFAEAARLLDEALENAEDPVLGVTIEMNLAFVHSQYLGNFSEAESHAARALELAERLGDPEFLGAPLAVSAHVRFINGRGIDWGKLERAVQLERTTQPVPLLFRPSLIAAFAKFSAGELDDARAQLAAVRLAWADASDESDVALLMAWQAWLETLAGNLDIALSGAEEAQLEAALTGSESSRAWALAVRALVHAQRGEVAAAREDARAAAAIAHGIMIMPPLILVASALGVLELSLGDPDAAWSAVSLLAEQTEVNGVGEVQIVFYLPEALEALIALGHLDRAEKLLESFESRARKLDRPWALFTSARSRALLLAERGDLDGANQALDRALVAHERSEMPFERARTLLVQGQVLRRRRERRAARESLEQALELFERLGASLWAQRARDELARFGRRASAGELTAAERRAVELAIDGLSNKQIAAALFVTVNTVEVHLSHAYAKLDVRSRAQLAGRMASVDDTARKVSGFP